MHHHRAEVGQVRQLLAGRLQGDPLVGAQLRVLGGEALQQLRVPRVDDGGLGQVEPQLRGAPGDGTRVAEEGDLRDVAFEDRVGRGQHPVVGGFGQHDPFQVPAGHLHQLVLEHARGADLGAWQLDGGQQRLLVDVPVEQGTRQFDLPWRTGGHPADLPQRDRGGEGVVVGGADGKVDLGVAQQRRHRLRDLEASRQQQRPQGAVGGGAVRHDERGQQVEPVGGDDDRGLLLEARQQVRQAHARDDRRQCLTVEALRFATPERRVNRLEVLADRRGVEYGVRGQHRDRDVPDLTQRRGEFLDDLGLRAGRDDGDDGVVPGLEGLDGLLRHPAHLVDGAIGGAAHVQHRRVQVGGDEGVVVQLGAVGEVVEIGSDDHDRLEPLRQRGVLRDDGVDGGLRVVGPVLVADTDAVFEALVTQGVGGQQRRRDAVLLQGLHQRTEEADRTDLARE